MSNEANAAESVDFETRSKSLEEENEKLKQTLTDVKHIKIF